MTRSSLESGHFSFHKRRRKVISSDCFLKILTINNSWCNLSKIINNSLTYLLRLILSSQGLSRRPSATKQNRLRPSIPWIRKPTQSCFLKLIISRRPVSRILFPKKKTVIIRTASCRGKLVLDLRSQWKKCYADGSRLLRRTCQPLTW